MTADLSRARDAESSDRLCWDQPPGRFVACDRQANHLGMHTWEADALRAEAIDAVTSFARSATAGTDPHMDAMVALGALLGIKVVLEPVGGIMQPAIYPTVAPIQPVPPPAPTECEACGSKIGVVRTIVADLCARCAAEFKAWQEKKYA